MQKISRQIFVELLWLAFSLGLAVLLFILLFGWSFYKNSIDIHVHDTMIVISSWQLLIPLYFFLGFSIYLIRTIRQSFTRSIVNLLLVIFGLLFSVSLIFLMQVLWQIPSLIWTAYPPLSAAGAGDGREITEDPTIRVITTILTAILLIVFLMLLFAAYRWGFAKSKSKKH